jgi:hypothetical protein
MIAQQAARNSQANLRATTHDNKPLDRATAVDLKRFFAVRINPRREPGIEAHCSSDTGQENVFAVAV